MPQLTAQSLFTPAVSGVNPTSPAAVPASGSWLATLLGIANTLQLPSTAWQPGQIARTMMAIVATVQAQQDGIVSLMSQGGFLDWASSGTVTYVNSQGATITAFVTPDPSIPAQNPTGAPGWLDALALSLFNVQRTFATFASGTLYLTNTSGTTYGPFVATGYHVANPGSGATYSNVASLSIPPSVVIGTSITNATNASPIVITTSSAHGLASGAVVSIQGVLGNTAANGVWIVTVTGSNSFSLNGSTGNGTYSAASVASAYTPQSATFQADISGSSSTSATGTITQAVTSLVGVSVVNLASFTGSNAQSNPTLVALCRAKQATISPNGPTQAYTYFALQAYTLLQSLATTKPFAGYTLIGGPITRAPSSVNTVTGIVTTTVANANGAVHGCAQVAVTAASNASPIQITTGVPHNLTTGDTVNISGVTGNTSANGLFVITVVNGTQFTLNGSTGNGTYGNGGIVEGSDLGAVDSIIQANVLPNATIAITQSATNFNVAIVATIWIPASLASSATSTLNTVLSLYFSNLPIGGLTDDSPALAYTNAIPYDAVLALLFEAFPNPAVQGASFVQQATLTLNGGTSNLTLTPTQVAVLSPAAAIIVNSI